jgi:hypothetical protein
MYEYIEADSEGCMKDHEDLQSMRNKRLVLSYRGEICKLHNISCFMWISDGRFSWGVI